MKPEAPLLHNRKEWLLHLHEVIVSIGSAVNGRRNGVLWLMETENPRDFINKGSQNRRKKLSRKYVEEDGGCSQRVQQKHA